MATLDRIALCVIVIALFFFGYVVAGSDLFWLLLAAIGCALYAWRSKDVQLFRISCFLPILYSFGFSAAWWVLARVHRPLLDAVLARLDHGVGLAAQRFCLHHPETLYVLLPAYYAMGAAVMVALALSDRRREMILALVIASTGAVICYWFFPAVGPRWVGVPGVFPNGIPSMHMGFALLCWIYIRPRFRSVMAIFVLLVVAATLGLGEHYVIDLMAAVPFTALVCWLSSKLMAAHGTTSTLVGMNFFRAVR